MYLDYYAFTITLYQSCGKLEIDIFHFFRGQLNFQTWSATNTDFSNY